MIRFYNRVNALLKPDMTVLDFGAGRGQGVLDDPVAFRRQLRSLRGKVRQVIGVDVDPVVLSNPGLDKAYVVALAADGSCTLPFNSNSMDIIVSDYTLEHVVNPLAIAKEFDRLLKPGGWIAARTPNRWGYIGVAGSMVPNRFHAKILRSLQPARREKDVFATFYRMNDRRTIRRLFPSPQFSDHSYSIATESVYAGSSSLLWIAFEALTVVTPRFALPVYLVFMHKSVNPGDTMQEMIDADLDRRGES